MLELNQRNATERKIIIIPTAIYGTYQMAQPMICVQLRNQ